LPTDADVNAQVDTALSDIGLDHLLSASVTGTDVTDDSIIAKLVSKNATADWDDFSNTTDSLQAIYDKINALNNLSTSDVNAEVLDVLDTDTFSELASVPGASPTLSQAIRWLYLLARNKITQTSTAQSVKADDASTEVASATVGDDGTTATRGEWS